MENNAHKSYQHTNNSNYNNNNNDDEHVNGKHIFNMEEEPLH